MRSPTRLLPSQTQHIQRSSTAAATGSVALAHDLRRLDDEVDVAGLQRAAGVGEAGERPEA